MRRGLQLRHPPQIASDAAVAPMQVTISGPTGISEPGRPAILRITLTSKDNAKSLTNQELQLTAASGTIPIAATQKRTGQPGTAAQSSSSWS